MTRKTFSLFDPALLKPAIADSFRKLDPRVQWRNPVMFVVFIGSILTTLAAVPALSGPGQESTAFILASRSGYGLRCSSPTSPRPWPKGAARRRRRRLRGLKKETWAKRLQAPRADAEWHTVAADELRVGNVVLVSVGETIPADGEVIEGVASVDESAITGESAPVIRESGGDFSAVTGGTRVLSDWLVVRVTVNPGETFVDRMIAMVETAKRQKTPNEIALTILLAALTIVFLGVTATLLPFSQFSVTVAGSGSPVSITVLIALLVCLIPTTIAGLLSAVGVAGMSRMMQANVIATSGRAVEAAGDVDVLLLDKTGTITLGNRQAAAFLPAEGVSEAELADAAQLASLADETPEGRSIVVLAKQRFNLRERDVHALEAQFVHFSAQTRMSGVDVHGRQIRKGATDAIRQHVEAIGGAMPASVLTAVERRRDAAARRWSLPTARACSASSN
jgi:K+-transporting ATPase ATPase B chain